MNAIPFSVATYLTVQIQQIIALGPIHTLTWASKSEWDNWLQLSVQGENRYYISVQFRLPHGSKKRFDKLFGQTGWLQLQDDQNDTVIYYLTRVSTSAELLAQSEKAAHKCAVAMQMLWGVNTVEQIALLGARGPRLPMHRIEKTPMSLPRAA